MSDPWKNRSKGMICETCVSYVEKKSASENSIVIGRCRKNAPTMKGFPVVYPNDWCGEHRLDENKVKPAPVEKDEKAEKIHITPMGNIMEELFDECNRPRDKQTIPPECRTCTVHPMNGGKGECGVVGS